MSKSDGALNNYLPEVGRVPLLTPDEEIELGRRIRNGDAAADERMIHSNLRLVVTIARDDVDFGLPLRATTLSETRGFLKALVDVNTDRILGFTGFAVDVGEILSSVQIAMLAGLPYTALRDGILTHPTLVEGLIPLFSSARSTHNVAETKPASSARQQTTAA